MRQHFLQVIVFVVLFHFLGSCEALECKLNYNDSYKVAYTITVSQSGTEKYTKIQDAIDSIPSGNSQWIRILIAAGEYWEKINIPHDKGCIYLSGSKYRVTKVRWGDHESTSTSATFTLKADNIIVNRITFENTYRPPIMAQALAVEIYGDKISFYHCSFISVQDTIGDMKGRHLFKHCYIEGAIDFIFGYSQSIYQYTDINVTMGVYNSKNHPGYITANGRKSPDSTGFVFNQCKIYGIGKSYLGRAWGPYSRVIFYDTEMSDVIVPKGWNSWGKQTDTIEYVEYGCKGEGANKAKRVEWMKTMSYDQLSQFVNLSYINEEDWLSRLPTVHE